MGPGHADEAARLGLPHAGHDGVHAHPRIDEHGHRAAAHHRVAQGEEVGARRHEHDHAFGGPQAGLHQAVLVGVDPSRERPKVERVVVRRRPPARKRDLRHRRHPRHRRGRGSQRLVEPAGRHAGSGCRERRRGRGWSNDRRRPEELADGRDRSAGRIFQHEMRGIGNTHHVGLRKPRGDLAEDPGMKAGVFHSPDDLHRRVGERRQPGHHVVHQRRRGVGR